LKSPRRRDFILNPFLYKTKKDQSSKGVPLQVLAFLVILGGAFENRERFDFENLESLLSYDECHS
jgi:hypothetical protein